MPPNTNTGAHEVSLRLAKKLSDEASKAFDNGSLADKVSPVTRDLLNHWFGEAHEQGRSIHFHAGQRQAILNTLYAHEVLKADAVVDLYTAAGAEAVIGVDPIHLKKDKYSHPKYCHKMATGTGKTWVMHALLLWQYLNSKADPSNPRFTRNFLLVAPGLIVYDRLLDAYLGKEQEDGQRDFGQSDFAKYAELFLPRHYRDQVFGFLQGSVVRKEEIGRKITGDGLIAIANWHVLQGEDEEDGEEGPRVDPLDDPSQAVRELFPVVPGTSQGHSLDTLDRNYLKGGVLDYLASLDSLAVFNDEAHHIHETRNAGIVSEVEWQRSLNTLAEGKGIRFLQIDFSATPYDVSGSGRTRKKHYFPHIITNFTLHTAIHKGLVKTLVLDKRKELSAEALQFKALRDEAGRITGLSDGQRVMLRAGLTKLKLLEADFARLTQDREGYTDKYPKMLVICEDTKVSPLVEEFLLGEGLTEEAVMRVDSDRKGNIPAKEWKVLKQRLFNVDRHEHPKVVISVLMLREGFDVNNICVVVPLRSSESPILLEQIIGRGLRLMWREPEYADIKAENRDRILRQKQAPNSYFDILSIVEHPAYLAFYQDLEEIGEVPEIGDDADGPGPTGDMITVPLRENYANFDLFWPQIIAEREETIRIMEEIPEYFTPVGYTPDQLRQLIPKSGEIFFSEELTVRTQFGEYQVSGEKLRAESYNELLGKLVQTACEQINRMSSRSSRNFFPGLQINQAQLARSIDEYIRTGLFNEPFDPMDGDNWKILLLAKQGVLQHLVKGLSEAIYKLQTQVDVQDASVIQHAFSQVKTLKMRESCSLPVAKCIYERLPYPAHNGTLEKRFIEACDQDTTVQSFLKINEHQHDFARLLYVRSDGALAAYHPDFLVKTADYMFLVETKGTGHLDSQNVKLKEQSALNWERQINELRAADRDDREWVYVLLAENTLYGMRDKGASVPEVLLYARLTQQRVEGKLL